MQGLANVQANMSRLFDVVGIVFVNVSHECPRHAKGKGPVWCRLSFCYQVPHPFVEFVFDAVPIPPQRSDETTRMPVTDIHILVFTIVASL